MSEASKNKLIKLLLNKVESVFGKPVSSYKDCEELKKNILLVTGKTVSYQTLRRAFGIIKYNFIISANTTNILANYVGFNSYQQFISDNKTSKLETYNLSSLLLETLYAKEWEEGRGIKTAEGATYYVSEKIFSNEKLFTSCIETYKSRKEFIITLIGFNPGYDFFKNRWYINGLLEIEKFNMDAEIQCFLQGVLCLYNFVYNKNRLQNNIEKLEKFLPLLRRNVGYIAFIEGRYYALAYIYYSSINNQKAEKIFSEVCKFITDKKRFSSGIGDRHHFLFEFCQIMNLANFHNKALYIYELAKLDLKEVNEEHFFSYMDKFKVIIAEMYFATNQVSLCKMHLPETLAEHQNFYFKNYFRFRYVYLKYKLQTREKHKAILMQNLLFISIELKIPLYKKWVKNLNE